MQYASRYERLNSIRRWSAEFDTLARRYDDIMQKSHREIAINYHLIHEKKVKIPLGQNFIPICKTIR